MIHKHSAQQWLRGSWLFASPVRGTAHAVLPKFAQMTSRIRSRPNSRGFTLTELMAVVVIVGILAVLAVVGFRRYLSSAHTSEAIAMIGAIKNAEEAYRAETLVYLNVSDTLETWYPTTTPNDKKVSWATGTNNANLWRQLNVTTDGPVMYGYAVVAGSPGADVPVGQIKLSKVPTFPKPIEPWYVVQAKGDTNADGIVAYAVSTSFAADILVENDGE